MDEYWAVYDAPAGRIILAATQEGISGLWFAGEKNPLSGNIFRDEWGNSEIFKAAREWLDIYFSGRPPEFTPKLALEGTKFQLAVWEMLLTIPFGETREYGEIARLLVTTGKVPRASARCVGGAVGRNRISIIVPCHRVIGAGGNLTGFGGGLDKKCALLENEGHELKNFHMPK